MSGASKPGRAVARLARRRLVAVAGPVLLLVTGLGVSLLPLLPARPDLRLVVTASLDGDLGGCACGDGRYAGLVRRATGLRRLIAAHPETALLDLGNSLSPAEDPDHDEAILHVQQQLGYRLMAVGDQELSNGIAALVEYTRRHPLGAANLSVRIGGRWERVGQAESLWRVDDLVVRAIALTGSEAFEAYPVAVRAGLRVEDPGAVAAAWAADGSGQVLIALYHGSADGAEALAATVPSLDLILYGRARAPSGPRRIGETVLLSPVAEGAGFTGLDLSVRDGRISRFRARSRRFNYYEDPVDEDLQALAEKLQ